MSQRKSTSVRRGPSAWRAAWSALQRRVAGLGRLGLHQRLAISGLMALLPLAAVLAVWLNHELVQLQRDRHARQGAQLVAPSLQLLHALHDAAQTRGALPPALRQRLHDASAAVDRSVQAADASLGLNSLWQPLQQRVQAAAAATAQGTAPGTDRALVAAVVQLPTLVAERTDLMAHRDCPALALATLRTQWIGAWLDGLAQYAAVPLPEGEQTAPGEAAASQARALALAEGLQVVQRQAGMQVDILARDQALPPARWQPARSATERALSLGPELWQAGVDRATRATFRDALDRAANEVLRLDAELAAQLDERLARQQQQALWRVAGLLALCALCWGVLALVAWTFARRFRSALDQVQASLDAVAGGDLSQTVALRGHDELAGMGARVERMSVQLSALVAEIRSSAVRLGEAGQAVADDGQGLSNRSDQQVASLHDAVQQVAQMGRGAEGQVDATHTLGALVGNLREQVKAGGAEVGETVNAILTLETTARRVAEINNVIDDIAFQTNLLALNASVEAARAGDAGKGFAVVAAEVRQLALRCAEAAAEVRQLIDRTTDQVSEASSRVQDASAQLDGVAASVQEVSRRITLLAETSGEQQLGLAQVHERVASLVQLSVDNQAALGRSTSASRVMARQAGALQRAVATMRLRQGTSDEAQDLVLRALQHVDSAGESAAFADFNRGADGWVDRDLYLFALDRAQRYRVAGARPAWLGRSTHELPGVRHAQADAFLALAWAAAEQGGAWIDYDGSDPVTHEPVPKSAYVMPLGSDMFIGCAVHRSHADGRLNVSAAALLRHQAGAGPGAPVGAPTMAPPKPAGAALAQAEREAEPAALV